MTVTVLGTTAPELLMLLGILGFAVAYAAALIVVIRENTR